MKYSNGETLKIPKCVFPQRKGWSFQQSKLVRDFKKDHQKSEHLKGARNPDSGTGWVTDENFCKELLSLYT